MKLSLIIGQVLTIADIMFQISTYIIENIQKNQL